MRPRTFIAPVALLIVWGAAAASGHVSPLFLPSPVAVAVALSSLFGNTASWIALGLTIIRILISLILSIAIGVPLGLLLGYFSKLYEASAVLVDFLRSLPAVAILPMMFLLLGIGESAGIATAVLGGSLVVILGTIYGARGARRLRLEAVQLLGASKWQLFRHVLFPDSLPQTFGSVRIAASLVTVIILVTEMLLGSAPGVGRAIVEAQLSFRVPDIFAWVLVAGFLGYGLNWLVLAIEGRVVHWQGR